MIKVYGIKDKAPEDVINTTSRSTNWSRGLSPFFLKPRTHTALNVENLWQYSKVYPIHVDDNNEPNEYYFRWSETGFRKKYGVSHH